MGAEPESRLGSSSFSSFSMLGALAASFVGGRAPGGADAVNERSLSARWRNSAEVSVLVWAASDSLLLHDPESSRMLHGSSVECMLLATLIREKRTGRSGPALDARRTRSLPSPVPRAFRPLAPIPCILSTMASVILRVRGCTAPLARVVTLLAARGPVVVCLTTERKLLTEEETVIR